MRVQPELASPIRRTLPTTRVFERTGSRLFSSNPLVVFHVLLSPLDSPSYCPFRDPPSALYTMSTKLAALALLVGSAAALSNSKPYGSKPDHVHAARAAGITAAPMAHADIARRQDTSLTAPDPAASTPAPLTDYYIPYTALPYKVNPYPYLRGPQSGYNICNSTTAGDESQCQTLIVNSIVRNVFLRQFERR
jgi:hypothetical protein